MSFSSVKLLGFPAISQHWKRPKTAVNHVMRISFTDKSCASVSLVTTFYKFRISNLSDGFENNLCTASFFFFHASTKSVHVSILSTLFLEVFCLHGYHRWRMTSSRLRNGLCVQHLVPKHDPHIFENMSEYLDRTWRWKLAFLVRYEA